MDVLDTGHEVPSYEPRNINDNQAMSADTTENFKKGEKLLHDELKEPALFRGVNGDNLGNIREFEVAEIKGWGANIYGTRFAFTAGTDAIHQLPGLLPMAINDMLIMRRNGMKCTIGLRGNLFADQTSKESLEFWTDPRLKPTLINIWKTIAKGLLEYRDVIHGFYLFGEPLYRKGLPDPPPGWYDMAVSITRAIREIDNETWIIFQPGPGGVPWGYKDMKPLPDNKVIYDVHFYTPHKFTHQGVSVSEETGITEAMKLLNVPYPMPWETTWESQGFEKIGYTIPRKLKDKYDKELQMELLRPAIEFQQKYKVPMIVLEFSAVRWSPSPDGATYLQEAIDIFEALGWSWMYHGWGMRDNHWNLMLAEGTDAFWMRGTPWPTQPVPYETERAKVIKAGLAKNLNHGFTIDED
ncbi:MAG: cellulase family glycosylhydrolase [Cyclobacteriaceae bacterium]|nr:cellulase family glycosylhydrolase [Cyclobacteriaceae bacterium]